VRAYGGAAAEALDRAAIVVVVPLATVRLVHAYEDSGVIAGVVRAWHVTPAKSDYGTEVRVEGAVPQAQVEAFVTALRDATAARARIRVEQSHRA
jgi:putative IMPACT (imprinted ancient) family translation regulator